LGSVAGSDNLHKEFTGYEQYPVPSCQSRSEVKGQIAEARPIAEVNSQIAEVKSLDANDTAEVQ